MEDAEEAGLEEHPGHPAIVGDAMQQLEGAVEGVWRQGLVAGQEGDAGRHNAGACKPGPREGRDGGRGARGRKPGCRGARWRACGKRCKPGRRGARWRAWGEGAQTWMQRGAVEGVGRGGANLDAEGHGGGRGARGGANLDAEGRGGGRGVRGGANLDAEGSAVEGVGREGVQTWTQRGARWRAWSERGRKPGRRGGRGGGRGARGGANLDTEGRGGGRGARGGANLDAERGAVEGVGREGAQTWTQRGARWRAWGERGRKPKRKGAERGAEWRSSKDNLQEPNRASTLIIGTSSFTPGDVQILFPQYKQKYYGWNP